MASIAPDGSRARCWADWRVAEGGDWWRPSASVVIEARLVMAEPGQQRAVVGDLGPGIREVPGLGAAITLELVSRHCLRFHFDAALRHELGECRLIKPQELGLDDAPSVFPDLHDARLMIMEFTDDGAVAPDERPLPPGVALSFMLNRGVRSVPVRIGPAEVVFADDAQPTAKGPP